MWNRSRLVLVFILLLAAGALGATWKASQSVYTTGDELTGVGGVRKDTRATLADADGEYTPVQFTSSGDLRVRDDDLNTLLGTGGGSADKWQDTATSADASSTEMVVKAGTADKKVACLFLLISSDTSLTVTVEDEDDNALATLYVAARGGAVLRFPPQAPLVVDTDNKALQIQTSGAGNVSATAVGYLYD